MMFPVHTIDREELDWLEFMEKLSPVEQHGGMYVKRDDLFAPLGEGGVNGSKMRSCLFMLNRRFEDGAETIFTGASVKSPQHSMTAAVCAYLGMDPVHVVGATKPETAMRHIQVRTAAWFGAKFKVVPVGYNPYLQKEVLDLLVRNHGSNTQASTMPYGISPLPGETLEFHTLGGLQTANLPDVHTLIVPAGSCNSVASILYGLQNNDRPSSLRRIITVGIGPSKVSWLWQRLSELGVKDGYRYNAEPRKALSRDPQPRNYLEICHLDPHGEKFSSYDDEMPEDLGGIALHPTYEGKVMRYLRTFFPHVLCAESCFWVIGGPMRESVMASNPRLADLGPAPLASAPLPIWGDLS